MSLAVLVVGLVIVLVWLGCMIFRVLYVAFCLAPRVFLLVVLKFGSSVAVYYLLLWVVLVLRGLCEGCLYCDGVCLGCSGLGFVRFFWWIFGRVDVLVLSAVWLLWFEAIFWWPGGGGVWGGELFHWCFCRLRFIGVAGF